MNIPLTLWMAALIMSQQRETPLQRFQRVVSTIANLLVAVVIAWAIISLVIGHPFVAKSTVQRDLEVRGFNHVAKLSDSGTRQIWSVGLGSCHFMVRFDKTLGQYTAHWLETGKTTHTATAENLRRSGYYARRCR